MIHTPDLERLFAAHLPATVDRVRDRSAPAVNRRIDREMEERVARLGREGPAALRARAAELDREWNVDRALMANFAVLGGASFAAGVASMRRRRGAWSRWHALLAVQLAFLGWHAVAGWCPPLPVFRRLGFRTAQEIAAERRRLEERLEAPQGA